MTTYTIPELLSLRVQNPELLFGPHKAGNSQFVLTQYLDLWNQYNGLLKRGPKVKRPSHTKCDRYNPMISNRMFKRAFLRSGRSLEELKTLPKKSCIVLSARVEFLESHFKDLESLRTRIESLRFKAFGQKALPIPRVSYRESPIVGLKPTRTRGVHNFDSVEESKARAISIVQKRSDTDRDVLIRVAPIKGTNDAIVSHPGGIAKEVKNFMLRIPPKPHHRKYWYFRRKNGFWRPSEHHPYGDEMELIELPDVDKIDYDTEYRIDLGRINPPNG